MRWSVVLIIAAAVVAVVKVIVGGPEFDGASLMALVLLALGFVLWAGEEASDA